MHETRTAYIKQIFYKLDYSPPWPVSGAELLLTQHMSGAWEQQALRVTLPTKVETPPRVYSCGDVQPSLLPHNTVYTASAHWALRPGQRRAITRQQAGRESAAQHRLCYCCYCELYGLMTDNGRDRIDTDETKNPEGRIQISLLCCDLDPAAWKQYVLLFWLQWG